MQKKKLSPRIRNHYQQASFLILCVENKCQNKYLSMHVKNEGTYFKIVIGTVSSCTVRKFVPQKVVFLQKTALYKSLGSGLVRQLPIHVLGISIAFIFCRIKILLHTIYLGIYLSLPILLLPFLIIIMQPTSKPFFFKS